MLFYQSPCSVFLIENKVSHVSLLTFIKYQCEYTLYKVPWKQVTIFLSDHTWKALYIYLFPSIYIASITIVTYPSVNTTRYLPLVKKGKIQFTIIRTQGYCTIFKSDFKTTSWLAKFCATGDACWLLRPGVGAGKVSSPPTGHQK